MEKFDNSFSDRSLLSEQKAVYANGKVYVFGKMKTALILNTRMCQMTILTLGLL